MSTDWRYCKCSHKANDHNPVHLGCFKCDCQQWTPDMERTREEARKRQKVRDFYKGAQRSQG